MLLKLTWLIYGKPGWCSRLALYSADMSPIEHLLVVLDMRVRQRPQPPATFPAFRQTIDEEWNAIPQALINYIILSVTRRIRACLVVNGGHAQHWHNDVVSDKITTLRTKWDFWGLPWGTKLDNNVGLFWEHDAGFKSQYSFLSNKISLSIYIYLNQVLRFFSSL